MYWVTGQLEALFVTLCRLVDSRRLERSYCFCSDYLILKMHYVPSNRRELTQWYSITSQKSGILATPLRETQIERCTPAGGKYFPSAVLCSAHFIGCDVFYPADSDVLIQSVTLQKSFCLIINCCLCASLNIRHVGELLKHKSTITPFINQSLCTTLCVLKSHTNFHFDIYWCRQEVQSYCNFFSTHLKSDFISDADWL